MAIADPRDIPGLVVWLSADYLAETAADGSAVSTWEDLSDAGNDATAAAALTLYHAGGPSSGPRVYGGGSGNQHLNFPSTLFNGATSAETYVTVKVENENGPVWEVSSGGGLDPHYPHSTGWYDSFGSSVRYKLTSASAFTTSWQTYHIWSAPNDWRGEVLSGAAVFTSATNTVAFNAGAPKRIFRNSATASTTRGSLGLVLAFDRKLTTTERSDLEAWIAANPSGGLPVSSGIRAVADAQSNATATAYVVVATVTAHATASAESHGDASPRMVNAAVTDNREGGRWRSGSGTATWSPAVILPPAPEIGGARLSALAFNTPTVDEATGRISYNATRVEQERHVDRVVVGNKDITLWRGVVTPIPGYGLVEPLGYGPATLVLPQVHGAFEVVGEGALRFLRPGAAVRVERVDRETGEVVAVDYKGVLVSFDVSGDALTCQVGGEASGRAALMERQVPIFYWYKDLGRYFHDAIRGLGLPFSPYLGPEVGIRVQRFGGTGYLDFIQQLVAMGWTRGGNRWTVMPNESTGKYEAFRKDTTTIHATAYLDDQRTVGSLVRDMSEEPNRIFLTGVQPDGLRVRFGAYPGLKYTNPPPYPFDDNQTFGQGTTDGDTDTGDGVTILINRLYITKYLDREDLPGGYDADVTRAIKDLQRDGGIAVTGNVNVKTWRVLYDLDSTGFSLRGARILPAAQKSEVKPWNLSPSGAKISRNPGFNQRVLPVDRNVDIGTGFEKDQMREWARAELEQAVASNWTGTLVFNTGALIAGQHDPGDPLTTADLMPAKALRAGMNIWLPLFDGGTLVHVSGIDVSPEGTVTASVDTRARDALEVWEVIARNRESRKSMRRAWIQEHRASTNRKDSIAPWDEVGGVLGDKVSVPGNRWVVFPVIAGQEGIIQRLRVDTNPNAEFVMAVFGRRIAAGRLRRMVGNPLTRVGSKRWERENLRDRLDAANILLYVAGSDSEPCGYWPKRKSGRNDADSGPSTLTGRWQDDATFPYRCFPAPVLWVAIWADRDTTIPRGRIMWPQLEAGA